jgi:ribosomal protein L11 methyltransferase
MTGTSAVWRILARVRGAGAADSVFAVLDEIVGAVSAFEIAPEEWRLEAYPQSPVLNPELYAHLAVAAVAAGGALIEIGEERLAARDWLAENQLTFPPLRIGRFFIYGSHYRGKVPAGAIGIAIDAAIAFGTGEHPSTQGCLRILERLTRRRRFRKPLDIGTGTGVLSIAAAKLLHRKILASDIDPAAVRIARHNVARNGVRRLVQVRRAAGYRDRAMRKSRHDLILANILARPLAEMAPDLAGVLAPNGRAVLAGLLRRQEPMVLAPHRGCGFVLDDRLTLDGWSMLVLRRRRGADMKMGAEAPISEFGPVERRFRPPVAARVLAGSAAGSAAPAATAYGRHRQERRFASDAARYRQANDHPAPSAQHKPVRDAATRKPLFPPK